MPHDRETKTRIPKFRECQVSQLGIVPWENPTESQRIPMESDTLPVGRCDGLRSGLAKCGTYLQDTDQARRELVFHPSRSTRQGPMTGSETC